MRTLWACACICARTCKCVCVFGNCERNSQSVWVWVVIHVCPSKHACVVSCIPPVHKCARLCVQGLWVHDMSMCSVVVSTWCALLMCETSAMTVEPSAPKGEIGCKCLCVCMCVLPPPLFFKLLKTWSCFYVLCIIKFQSWVYFWKYFQTVCDVPFNV